MAQISLKSLEKGARRRFVLAAIQHAEPLLFLLKNGFPSSFLPNISLQYCD